MNSSSPPIGALIIVPIVIAASAAFVALKTQHGFRTILSFCRRIWNRRPSLTRGSTSRRRRKHNRSDIGSSSYADSWCDLESIHSSQGVDSFSTFIGQSPINKAFSEGDQNILCRSSPTPSQVWHPNRSNRLQWSFTNPGSRSPRPLGLLSVARPSPVAHRPERLSIEGAQPLVHPTRVRGAHHWAKTDL